VTVGLQYIGDEPVTLWRNKSDGQIFAEGSMKFILRVSNNSEYPLTVDDVIVSTSDRPYTPFSAPEWEYDYLYMAGADVVYEAAIVNVCTAASHKRRAFINPSYGESEVLAKFRKVAYLIPPHQTEYVVLDIHCYAAEDETPAVNVAIGKRLTFEPIFILKGNEFSRTIPSQIGLLHIDDSPETPGDDSSPRFLERGHFYSGYQDKLDKEFDKE
jgi:hypothetical protein